jgi:hypothetical protein
LIRSEDAIRTSRAKKLTLEMVIPIRWGDMDAMGTVNNTIYFRYLEIVRMEGFSTSSRRAARRRAARWRSSCRARRARASSAGRIFSAAWSMRVQSRLQATARRSFR